MTIHVHDDVRYLRSRSVARKLAALAKGTPLRGMTIVLSQTMSNPIHLVVQVRSRRALHNATRYLFGLLARSLNKLNDGRKGAVFTERFSSGVARSTVDAWNVVGYVVRNPKTAGIQKQKRPFDHALPVAPEAIMSDRFLRKLLGEGEGCLWELLYRMSREPVPYHRLWREPHPQLALPLGCPGPALAGQGLVLRGYQLLDSRLGQVHQLVQLLAREGVSLRRALDLYQRAI